jgi:heme exporter protein CcmD
VTEFFHMDGYAAYVWPSYAITLTVLLLNVYWARRAFSRAREDARRRIAMQETRP